MLVKLVIVVKTEGLVRTATRENSMVVPQKIKSRLTI